MPNAAPRIVIIPGEEYFSISPEVLGDLVLLPGERMDRPVSLRVVEARPARYEFTCWGEFALVDGTGRNLSPRGRKARAILAWLAAHPDMPVSRERLAGLLWSDRGEEQARASLRQCLYELRHLSNGGASLLSVARDHVTLNSTALADNQATGDLRTFATEIAAGEGVLFRDLDDVSEGFDEWLRAERPRRRAVLIASALDAAKAGLAREELAGARDLLGALAGLDPLDETIARAAMTADARAGDVAALERRYQRLRSSLGSELGVEPSGETQGLHRDLLRQLGREAPRAEEEEPLPDAAVEPVPAEPATKPRWRRLAPALAVLVAALLAAVLYWLVPNPFRQASAEPATLAVLPFRNLAPGDDYFAEGVSEEILSQLSKQPELRVAGQNFIRDVQGPGGRRGRDRAAAGRRLCSRGRCSNRRRPGARGCRAGAHRGWLQAMVAGIQRQHGRHLCNPAADRLGRRGQPARQDRRRGSTPVRLRPVAMSTASI